MANLISRTEYKSYMGITSANKDTEIDILIPKVSQLVKTYCRRTFIDYYSDIKVEYFNGGFNTILLNESPVKEVLSVGNSTDYGQNYTNLVEYTDYVLDGDQLVYIKSPYIWPEKLKAYKVEYFGGYEDTPEDLKLAVLDLVEYYSKNNSAVHVNRDVTPNVTQINYVNSTNFPAHIKRVLDQYIADYA